MKYRSQSLANQGSSATKQSQEKWKAFYQSTYNRRLNYRPTTAVQASRNPRIEKSNSHSSKQSSKRLRRMRLLSPKSERKAEPASLMAERQERGDFDDGDNQQDVPPQMEDSGMVPAEEHTIGEEGKAAATAPDGRPASQRSAPNEAGPPLPEVNESAESEEKVIQPTLTPVLVPAKAETMACPRYSVGHQLGGGGYHPDQIFKKVFKRRNSEQQEARASQGQRSPKSIGEVWEEIERAFDHLEIENQAKAKGEAAPQEEAKEQLKSESAKSELASFKQPSEKSQSERTVVFDEEALTSPEKEDDKKQRQFHRLVREQTVKIINEKLDNFWQLSPRKRSQKQYTEVLLGLCQNYFVEQSQDELDFMYEEEDAQLMDEMVQKLQLLFQSDVKRATTKP